MYSGSGNLLKISFGNAKDKLKSDAKEKPCEGRCAATGSCECGKKKHFKLKKS